MLQIVLNLANSIYNTDRNKKRFSFTWNLDLRFSISRWFLRKAKKTYQMYKYLSIDLPH